MTNNFIINTTVHNCNFNMWLCVGMIFIQWSHRNSFSSQLHVLVVSFLNLSGRFQTNTHPQTQRQWLTSLAWFRSSPPYSKFQQNMNKLWTKVILEILTKVIANSRQYSRVLLHKFYWPHKGCNSNHGKRYMGGAMGQDTSTELSKDYLIKKDGCTPPHTMIDKEINSRKHFTP